MFALAILHYKPSKSATLKTEGGNSRCTDLASLQPELYLIRQAFSSSVSRESFALNFRVEHRKGMVIGQKDFLTLNIVMS